MGNNMDLDYEMFCYQCEQTANGKGCTRLGVCGKTPEIANLQDLLIYQVKGISCYGKVLSELGHPIEKAVIAFIESVFFTTLTNVNFDNQAIQGVIDQAVEERKKLEMKEIPVVDLFVGETDRVSLRSTLLFGMKGMAAYAHHADRLGHRDEEINQWFYKGLCEINRDHSVN